MAKKEQTTYLIVHTDGTERRITVPSDWKVTFGPVAKGVNKTYQMPLALRFYENETRQRAIFTDVVSFRDMSIPILIRKEKTQEKKGFMECEGQKKATTFKATISEWINPDEIDEKIALPGSADVEAFDVDFVN